MPTLDWIGKQAVVRHHAEVPFHLLKEEPELSCGGEAGAGNLIVQGDNLKALKALLPHYGGQVKCIYIDPPYNTGNEGWVYNDNVNSPEMKRWLESTVGKEGEDLTRHDKWLCMMYPRLMLLKRFLCDDGAIFVSIDDNEVANLRLMMDEIFGASRFVACLIWKRRETADNRNVDGVSPDHEYLLCYSGSGSLRFRGREKDLTKYSNPDKDKRGPWMSDNLTGLADARERPNLHYPLVNPSTGIEYPPHPARGWAIGQDRMRQMIEEDRILWPKKETGRPRLKRFQSDMQNANTGFSTVLDIRGNVVGTKDLSEILGPKAFAFPKTAELIQTLITQVTAGEDLILDSFAGSGTTGHAVLKQNVEDGGNRRFILVEMDENIAQTITAERVRRVSQGYKNAKGEAVSGLGSGFRFAKLGKTLFDETGAIREDVKFRELAEFVYFHHTGSPMPKGWKSSPLLGIVDGRAIYLLYNGILGDRSIDGGNVLTAPVLAELPPHNGPKTIYAAACRLGPNRLERERIQFKQTPYGLRVD